MIILTVLLHTVAKIGFLNTTTSVNETSEFSTLIVAVLGNITLGREVMIHFSTVDISTTGDETVSLLSTNF